MKKISGIIILIAGSMISGVAFALANAFGWRGSTFTSLDIPDAAVASAGVFLMAVGVYLIMKDKN